MMGQFETAAAKLRGLVASAPGQVQQARAAELLAVSEAWLKRGADLVEQRELAGSDLLSRRGGHRTADEIGVLYLSSIAYGLGTGAWIDIETDANSASGVILPPLLSAGLSAGAVALLDRGDGMRYGAAQAIASGMTIGLAQGVAWTTYFQAASGYESQLSSKEYASVLWSSTTAGAVTGAIIGQVSRSTPGRAAFVSSATLWPALAFGLAGAGLSSDDQHQDDHAFLASAIGASAGTIAGTLLAGQVAPTTARVRFLDLGAVAGGLAAGGLAAAAAPKDTNGQGIFLAADAGLVGGVALAWALTRNMPRDEGAEYHEPKATILPTLTPQKGGLGVGVAGIF